MKESGTSQIEAITTKSYAVQIVFGPIKILSVPEYLLAGIISQIKIRLTTPPPIPSIHMWESFKIKALKLCS